MSSLGISSAAAEMQSDESLVWSLREFHDHRRALEFVRHFSNSLSIFSNKVGQIYAKYDVDIITGSDEELIVVPDLEAFTETWYSIPDRAIKPTGYTILPGGVVGKSGLFLHIPFADSGKGRAVPLAAGLRAVSDEFQQRGEEFLPLLTKGDLRAFKKQAPMLNLHRLDLAEMREKSRFEISDIRSGIRQKLRACME
ncbi:MAG: hypothetical protein P1U67_04495 [Alcanivoracaceae bacterium]|nr:hypothetical protein [Alcanivoracaceae bacterium]